MGCLQDKQQLERSIRHTKRRSTTKLPTKPITEIVPSTSQFPVTSSNPPASTVSPPTVSTLPQSQLVSTLSETASTKPETASNSSQSVSPSPRKPSKKHEKIPAKPIENPVISPLPTPMEVFTEFSRGQKVVPMTEALDFFSALGFPLDQGESFIVFYLLGAKSFEWIELEAVERFCKG